MFTAPTPATAVMLGPRYEKSRPAAAEAGELTPRLAPTLSDHGRFAPTPGGITHVRIVWFQVETGQTNSKPLRPNQTVGVL